MATTYTKDLSESLSVASIPIVYPGNSDGLVGQDEVYQGSTVVITFTARNENGLKHDVHPDYGPYVEIVRGERQIKRVVPERIGVGTYCFKWDTRNAAPGEYDVKASGTLDDMEFCYSNELTLKPTADAFRNPWRKYLKPDDDFSFNDSLILELNDSYVFDID